VKEDGGGVSEAMKETEPRLGDDVEGAATGDERSELVFARDWGAECLDGSVEAAEGVATGLKYVSRRKEKGERGELRLANVLDGIVESPDVSGLAREALMRSALSEARDAAVEEDRLEHELERTARVGRVGEHEHRRPRRDGTFIEVRSLWGNKGWVSFYATAGLEESEWEKARKGQKREETTYRVVEVLRRKKSGEVAYKLRKSRQHLCRAKYQRERKSNEPSSKLVAQPVLPDANRSPMMAK
jgi:hypothetical protein